MPRQLVCSFAKSAKSKWVKSISVAAFRACAEFVAAGFVYLTGGFHYRYN